MPQGAATMPNAGCTLNAMVRVASARLMRICLSLVSCVASIRYSSRESPICALAVLWTRTQHNQLHPELHPPWPVPAHACPWTLCGALLRDSCHRSRRSCVQRGSAGCEPARMYFSDHVLMLPGKQSISSSGYASRRAPALLLSPAALLPGHGGQLLCWCLCRRRGAAQSKIEPASGTYSCSACPGETRWANRARPACCAPSAKAKIAAGSLSRRGSPLLSACRLTQTC